MGGRGENGDAGACEVRGTSVLRLGDVVAPTLSCCGQQQEQQTRQRQRGGGEEEGEAECGKSGAGGLRWLVKFDQHDPLSSYIRVLSGEISNV